MSAVATEDQLFGTACLIIAAHPDDEVIGIGGQLARLAGGGRLRAGVFLPAADRPVATLALNDMERERKRRMVACPSHHERRALDHARRGGARSACAR